MRVSIGADFAGDSVKPKVIEAIEALGHTVVDNGKDGDFPDITHRTCQRVLEGDADKAVLVCGTGVGAVMAANKIPGIRCGLANETYSAHQAVEHDDANAIAIGAWLVPPILLSAIVKEFLGAQFDNNEDVIRRVRKLNALDELLPVGQKQGGS